MVIDFILNPIAMRRDLHAGYRRAFRKYMPPKAVVYDIGCGQKPFAEFLYGNVGAHVGVDIADGFYKPDQVDLIGTAYDVPAPDGIADAVILSEVIEHLESPLLAMREAYRLLKPGGLVFLSFPFLYPQHAPPRDFLRFTEFYLVNEIAGDSFAVIETVRLGGFWYLMGMNMGLYLQELDRGLIRRIYLVKGMSAIVKWICLALHKAEGGFIRATGRDASTIRARWTANYMAVLRKKEDEA